mgnify:FL=1
MAQTPEGAPLLVVGAEKASPARLQEIGEWVGELDKRDEALHQQMYPGAPPDAAATKAAAEQLKDFSDWRDRRISGAGRRSYFFPR